MDIKLAIVRSIEIAAYGQLSMMRVIVTDRDRSLFPSSSPKREIFDTKFSPILSTKLNFFPNPRNSSPMISEPFALNSENYCFCC